MSRDTTSSATAVWGMWANTGDVDPVLARMLHLLMESSAVITECSRTDLADERTSSHLGAGLY
jgi:hypothetical protein